MSAHARTATERLLLEKDWSTTPLGPRADWPQGLHRYVELVFLLPTPAILFWGPELVQIYNDGYAAIMGPRHPKYFGAPYRECWPDTYPIIYPWMRRVIDDGEVMKIEKAFFGLTRHGFDEEAYFTFTFTPIASDHGKNGGVYQPILEVTEGVLAERRAETLRALAPRPESKDPTRDAIDVLAANAKDIPFAAIFLWDEESGQAVIAGRSENLADEPMSQIAAAASRAMREDVPAVLDDVTTVLARVPEGPWPVATRAAIVLPMRRSTVDVPRGAIVFGLSSALRLDDTYRGFLETVASQVTSALDAARTLREAQERAEALASLDRAKTAFFSNVSHELRTPLTLMLGPTEDALARPDRALSGDALEMVHRNELRLLKLTNALLDFSRIEAGRVDAQLVPTDLASLTTDLAEAFRVAIESAGLTFRVACDAVPEAILVDRAMWEKIVLNLLSNALKFTFEGAIDLRLVLRGDAVELSVADTGTGIAAASIERVFERFERVAQARSRTHEGTGIGLSLVSELTKIHDGSVRVESEVGKGSTFFVTLPRKTDRVAVDPAATSRPPPTSLGIGGYVAEALRWTDGPGAGGGRVAADAGSVSPAARAPSTDFVLVADDNADMRDYLVGLLSPRYRVEAVSNGLRALEIAREKRPDLVVSDVMMPGLDGFALLRALREDPLTKGIAVVMLSARAGEEASVEGIEAGADDYLVKPFSARELFARVEARLEVRKLNQSLERRVEERTAELVEVNDELESFSYSVSHDLRAPLRHILGFGEMLDRRLGATIDDRSRSQLQTVIQAARRGGQLVDDLLAFSRLGRTPLRKSQVDVASLVADLREEIMIDAKDRQIELVVGTLPAVQADGALLRLVLKNLLANAIKYTRNREVAKVDLTAEERATETEFCLADNGVGFDMAYVDKLFGVFQRLHGADEFEGTGIGLALVRRIVGRHGGKTWAIGELGTGARFYFTLPRADGSAKG